MVLKEVIEARWKFIVGVALCVVVAGALAGTYDLLKNLLASGSALQKMPQSLQGQVQQMLGSYDVYVWSNWFDKNGAEVVAVLAAVLGCGLIGGEVNKGTIYFMLSKPVSRVRVLLIKYAVNALLLLVIVAAASLALLVTAAIVGHPQNLGGLAVSTLLLWLGALFVLGLALLFSVLFKDILRPLMLSLIITILMVIPGLIPHWSNWSLTGYWTSQSAYLGQEFPLKALLICLVAAIIPVLISIPLFQRQSY